MTAKNEREIAEQVSNVDPLKSKKPYKKGDTFKGNDGVRYKVVEV